MSDMPEQTAERIEILRNDEAGRYEITVDGDVAGFADFQNDGGVRIMPHTVIDPAYGGRGLASRSTTRARPVSRSPRTAHLSMRL